MGKKSPGAKPLIGVRKVFGASGEPILTLPQPVTADFMRSCFRKQKRELKVDVSGNVTHIVDHDLVRAQIPYLVTLYIYRSQFDTVPYEMEWFLYAPGDLRSAAVQAQTMWRRWFKPARKVGAAPSGIDMEHDYPRVAHGLLVEPIDDNFFDESWRYAKTRPHKTAGHPDRPWLFTCLDEGFKIYRHTDRQQGLIHRIT